MTQTAEKVPTADKILEYLRNYGPNARLLIVGHNRNTLDYFMSGNEGLLKKGAAEFSAADPKVQLTHKGGGVVRLTTLDNLVKLFHSGQLFGMVVFESVPEPTSDAHALYDEQYHKAKEEAHLILRLQPTTFIESEDGYVK